MNNFSLAFSLLIFIWGNIHAQSSAGTALQFDGFDDWVEVPDSPSLNPTAQITVEAWVYSDVFDRSQWQEFIMKGGNSAPSEPRQYYLRPQRDDGELQFLVHDSLDNIYSESSDTTLVNGMWHHVAGTYDGNLLKVYINGVLEDTDTVGTVSIVQSSEVLAFGRLGSIDAEYYQGQLDEIRIWNVARTHDQLQSTMSDTLGPEYYATADSGLVGYWRFDESSGNTVFDLTGNNNDGIIHGAVYVPSGAVLEVKLSQNNLLSSPVLAQNYPNPFNPSTRIRYRLESRQFVSLRVYNILGKEVAMLVNEEKPAGEYEVEFNGSGFASGIYFYHLQSENYYQTKKMLLMR